MNKETKCTHSSKRNFGTGNFFIKEKDFLLNFVHQVMIHGVRIYLNEVHSYLVLIIKDGIYGSFS